MKKQTKRKRFYLQRGRNRRWYNIMQRPSPEDSYDRVPKAERNMRRYVTDKRKLNRLYTWGQQLRLAEFLNK